MIKVLIHVVTNNIVSFEELAPDFFLSIFAQLDVSILSKNTDWTILI